MSTQAPSEKHLEDYLWNHSEALGTMDLYSDGEEIVNLYDFEWRQLRLPSGIVDLAGTAIYNKLFFAELKKGEIDIAAFAQIMRYMRDFKALLNVFTRPSGYQKYLQSLFPGAKSQFEPHDYERAEYGACSWSEAILKPVLIGSKISDKNLILACNACNVSIFTYNYDNGEYTFTPIQKQWNYDAEQEIMKSAPEELKETMHLLVTEELEEKSRNNATRSPYVYSAVRAAEIYLEDQQNASEWKRHTSSWGKQDE